MLQNVAEIFEAFGGTAATGRVIGAKPSTASEMKRRGAIPVRYWPLIVAEAQRRGIDLNNDRLVELHAGIDAAPSPLTRAGAPSNGAAGGENQTTEAAA